LNLSAYVNNPISLIDPTGLAPCPPNVRKFIEGHYTDAQTIASTLGNNVTPAEILAVSSSESLDIKSETGLSKAALVAGNYFGIHGPGTTGSILALKASDCTYLKIFL
jgi:hypothetical protein